MHLPADPRRGPHFAVLLARFGWIPTENVEPVEPAGLVDAGCGSDQAAYWRWLAELRPLLALAAVDTELAK